MKSFILSLRSLFLSVMLTVPSQGQERWVVPRLEGAIEFDGVPDEAAWEQVAPFPVVTHFPVSGNPPGEETEIRLAYDEEFVYVGAILRVSGPDLIRAIGKKRDFESAGCDWFGVGFDTYNDNENALLFFTNPNGLRWDASVMNDATPNRMVPPVNLNWNTYWDVKTVIADDRWTLEMKIPVSSLRFQEEQGITVMGFNTLRWTPAVNEMVIYPETSLEFGEMAKFKPSLYTEIEFQELESKRPLYISPYLLAGMEQKYVLTEEETAYEYSRGFPLEPGLDIKYGITPNATLDLTVNTDFAQVEADDQQFNLTRFSLVFPEKRPFFLERSSIFDFGLGGPNNLFYSRQIGLYEDQPVRIWGGARLNSRVKDWDIGLLDLQTASLEDYLPSENFGVFRVKRRVFNPYSYAGGMLTSRIGVDGSYNINYGLDGVIRLFGDDYLTLRWAQTFADSAENHPLSLDPVRFMVNWEKRKEKGLTYSLMFTRSGTGFEPGIGLETFEDYYSSVAILKYTWISPEGSPLHNHYVSLEAFHINDVVSNEVLTVNVMPMWVFNTKNNALYWVSLIFNHEKLVEPFEILDPVSVPEGTYDFWSANLIWFTPQARSLSSSLSLEAGQYYDGYRISPGIEPKWNLGASVELGGIYRYDHVIFAGSDQELHNHIAGLRALYMLNTKISFSAFVQYNTAIHKVISNFRFRYNPREGTDLYLVFNEGRNTYLEREVPNLPAFEQRNVTVKFTYTCER